MPSGALIPETPGNDTHHQTVLLSMRSSLVKHLGQIYLAPVAHLLTLPDKPSEPALANSWIQSRGGGKKTPQPYWWTIFASLGKAYLSAAH